MTTNRGSAVVIREGPMTGGKANRLEELYVAHIDGAVRLAFLMTGDEQLARDLAQDAFVKIAGRFQGLRDPRAFQAYLRATVINLSRGHLRRLRTQREYLARKERQPDAQPFPPIEERDALWRLLQSLPHRQRAALVLRYYEDLSERQIADALASSESAVKSLLARGLKELRVQMGGDA